MCNASNDSEAVADKKTAVINTVTDSSSGRMFKQITINGVQVNALIDTGSQITVMRKDVYDRMKLDKLRGNNICLTGFGKNEVHSLGCVNIIIDADEYPCVVHVVRKKDGSPRVCIDYRKLNRVIEKDGHSLPLIEDLLDKLDARVFSTLDLKNGFFHVFVEKESQ